VHRLGPQRLQLVVVCGAVELERIDPAGAFVRVEPTSRRFLPAPAPSGGGANQSPNGQQ